MLQDFGKKIGGARKDTWKREGLKLEDVSSMNMAEKIKYVKRDRIWPKPNYEKMIKDGVPRLICYWQDEMRRLIAFRYDGKIAVEEYISAVENIRNQVEQVTNESGIKRFVTWALNGNIMKKTASSEYEYVDLYSSIINGKKLQTMKNRKYLEQLKQKMDKSDFCLSGDERMERDFPIMFIDESFHEEVFFGKKSAVTDTYPRKRVYIPENMSFQSLSGKFVVTEKDSLLCVSEDQKACEDVQKKAFAGEKKSYLDKSEQDSKKVWKNEKISVPIVRSSSLRYGPADEISFRIFGNCSGEFGNWTNDMERQNVANIIFDAFSDIATALDIVAVSVSLPNLSSGGLSFSFGSRSRGSTSVHYEKSHDVINIPKSGNVGSIAHAWSHALDHSIGRACGSYGFGTDLKKSPSVLSEVLRKLVYENPVSFTSYYQDSLYFNKHYAKNRYGEWASKGELFARAFACYIEDKLDEKGYRNDYLCGHADSYECIDSKGKLRRAYPYGEERKSINKAMDELILFLKKEKLLVAAKKTYVDEILDF